MSPVIKVVRVITGTVIVLNFVYALVSGAVLIFAPMTPAERNELLRWFYGSIGLSVCALIAFFLAQIDEEASDEH